LLNNLRLEWLDDVIRMEAERMPPSRKIFLVETPQHKISRKTKDVVDRDALEIRGIEEWRRQAGNREEWRRLLRDARAQKGL
jgi:hypothetical protein